MNKNETPEVEVAQTETQDVRECQEVQNTDNGSETASGKSPRTRKRDVEEVKKLRDQNDSLMRETGELKDENERLKRELQELKDLYQRMLAEYANYKRRTESEKEQLGEFIKSETIKSLLPALDNLERAIDSPPGDDYKTGVDMTIRQLTDLLSQQGLVSIMPLGEEFNPEIHHAVMREDADGVEPETITEVFQKGYKLGNRLLRPAMVKVAN